MAHQFHIRAVGRARATRWDSPECVVEYGERLAYFPAHHRESAMDTDKIRAITIDCTQLVYRAMHHTDAGRWEELIALYAENGKLTRPTEPDSPIVGRANILASLRARPPLTTRHLISNVVVDVQSDTAARITSTIVRFSGPVKTTSPTKVDRILIGDVRGRSRPHRRVLEIRQSRRIHGARVEQR